jgi:hypothetical protein
VLAIDAHPSEGDGGAPDEADDASNVVAAERPVEAAPIDDSDERVG